MVGVDFSESCKNALLFAIKLAQTHGSKIFVFHMAPVPPTPQYTQAVYDKDISRLKKKLDNFCMMIPAETVGSLETVRTNCEENFRQTVKFVPEIIDEQMFLIIQAATRAFLQRKRALFQRRNRHGNIRDCHGDLRTGHIYFGDSIKIIDCIEFNDRFRYADITSDLAFLAMDLDFEGYPQISQDLIYAYLECSKDEEMLILLDFYKCYRAYVRVKVNCFHLQEESLLTYARSKLIRETERYLRLAYRYAVQFTRPTIWVVCGLPGVGKSTISKEMAGTLNVKILQSDWVRKQLLGVPSANPRDMPFKTGIYSKEASSLTYGKLTLLAQEVVEKQSGHFRL